MFLDKMSPIVRGMYKNIIDFLTLVLRIREPPVKLPNRSPFLFTWKPHCVTELYDRHLYVCLIFANLTFTRN